MTPSEDQVERAAIAIAHVDRQNLMWPVYVEHARAALTAAMGDISALEAKYVKLGNALLDVYEFMAEDHKTGDSDLWTVGYSELFDTVDEALDCLAEKDGVRIRPSARQEGDGGAA